MAVMNSISSKGQFAYPRHQLGRTLADYSGMLEDAESSK